MTKTKKSKYTAKEADKLFDEGTSLTELLDVNTATRRATVDLPRWMIDELDKESTRIGISRQALIKVWLNEKLEHLKKKIA